MASSPRSREREEERRLNLRTLVIASVASAAAAGVTSQLWIAGTWVAAAVTPVLVTLVSELLSRPTERIAQVLTSDSSPVPDPEAPPRAETTRPPGAEREPDVAPPAPDTPPDPDAPQAGAAGPVRVYRQPSRRPPRRRIAVGVVATTAAIAFVAGVVLFTTTELIAGESIGKSDKRTTLGIGGSSNKKKSEPQRQEPTDTSEEQRQQTETSTEQEEEEPPPETETAPPSTVPTEPPTETVPTERTPTPTTPQAETAPAP
jgi:hypothetical protein